MAPTREDVARDAGVSHGTVSNVLNNIPSVDESIRGRVLQSIRRLGYIPNESARKLKSMSSGREAPTYNLGCVLFLRGVTLFSSPFHFSLVEEIEKEAIRQRYHLYFYYTTDQLLENMEIHGKASPDKVDGLIFIAGMAPDEKKLMEEFTSRVPDAVFVGQYADSRYDSVDVNREQAAFDAVDYLAGLGHRRIAFIGNTEGENTRFTGYKKALGKHSIEYDAGLTGSFGSGISVQQSCAAMNRVLASAKARPTAVFAESDMNAIGAMNAIMSRGLSIPGDISVIGYDNLREAAETIPPLTTMDIGIKEIARVSVQKLLSRIRKSAELPTRTIIPARLVVRGSTAGPKG